MALKSSTSVTYAPHDRSFDNLQGDLFLHRLDPRGKILVFTAFILLVGLTKHTETCVWALVAGALVSLFAGFSCKTWFKRFLAVNVFVVFLWITLPFRLSYDQAGFSWSFTQAGLVLSLLITLKVNAIFFVSMSLLGTSPIHELAQAMAKLGMSSKIVSLFLLFYRYVHVITQEYFRLVTAMKMRGFRPGTNLHTYRTYASLLGILLVRGFDRAQRVFNAMLLRGYCGSLPCLDYLKMRKKDWIFVITGLVLVGFLALL